MYYHGVINGLVDKKVIDIFNKREISSASRIGYSKRIGFNENDYVCVCANMGEEEYSKYPKNAFNKYIVNHFCFIIDHDVPAIRPEFLDDAGNLSGVELAQLKRNNPDKRFTDLIDEYQVKYCISFEHVVGVGIPYNLPVSDGFIKLSDFCYLTPDEFMNLVNKVEEFSHEFGFTVLDSSSSTFGNIFNSEENRTK